jgi:hypothetical protein
MDVVTETLGIEPAAVVDGLPRIPLSRTLALAAALIAAKELQRGRRRSTADTARAMAAAAVAARAETSRAATIRLDRASFEAIAPAWSLLVGLSGAPSAAAAARPSPVAVPA